MIRCKAELMSVRFWFETIAKIPAVKFSLYQLSKCQEYKIFFCIMCGICQSDFFFLFLEAGRRTLCHIQSLSTGLVAAFNAPHMKLIRVSTHQGGPSLPVLRTLSGSGPIYSEGEDDSNSIWSPGLTLSRFAGCLSLTRPPSRLSACTTCSPAH